MILQNFMTSNSTILLFRSLSLYFVNFCICFWGFQKFTAKFQSRSDWFKIGKFSTWRWLKLKKINITPLPKTDHKKFERIFVDFLLTFLGQGFHISTVIISGKVIISACNCNNYRFLRNDFLTFLRKIVFYNPLWDYIFLYPSAKETIKIFWEISRKNIFLTKAIFFSCK